MILQEAIKDVSVDTSFQLRTDVNKQTAPWYYSTNPAAFSSKVVLQPNTTRLRYDRATQFALRKQVPKHDEQPRTPEVAASGEYEVDYNGALSGSFVYTIDLGPFEQWLGVTTAIIYGCYTVEADVVAARNSDWSLTIDLNSVMQWSTPLFFKLLGGQAGQPTAWFFKYIGLMLPNPGKITLGLKLFGQFSPQFQQMVVDGDLYLNVSTYAATGWLSGEPQKATLMQVCD